MDPQRLGSHLRLAGLFVAITACFLVYSLIQERLMTLGFDPEKERFKHSLFIILVNRLVTCAVAAAALGLLGKSLQPAAPLKLFSIPSLANVISSSSQYEALKYVSFPLQALAKCAKTVPVMAWGLLLGGRRYDAIDYASAITVTFGCALFVLTGNIAAPEHDAAKAAAAAMAMPGMAAPDLSDAAAAALQTTDAAALAAGAAAATAESSSWVLYGLVLLAAFLLFDGLTSTAQDKLFAQYDMHYCNQLLWVSIWSTGYSLASLVFSGQLLPAIQFVGRHPIAMGYILLLSCVSAAVQLFIFFTIQQYGALHFALIMTIRQFLSIVLSCLVFSHDLSPAQWLGTALVIGGLVARGMHKGGLDRTSKKLTPVKKSGWTSPGPRQQLMSVLVTPGLTPSSSQEQLAAPTLAPDHHAAAKKDVGSIAVDVQAGALASGQPDSGSPVRNPLLNGGGKGAATVTTRRKAQDSGML